ncbi:MAG: type III secretion system export apparatus subunit SctS [Bradyrhizobium sp.]|uniref:type III secretion system export apparatus subunit SctS n=1 Tax=Bradyrhizobium oligotrophicum TaxID=44255 RepID=UPI003C83910D
MGEASIVDHFVSTLIVVMTFSLPPLIVAMVVGLIVSVLQAATQIQDQTLPQSIKLMAVVATLATFGTALAAPLVRYTEQVLVDFPGLTR